MIYLEKKWRLSWVHFLVPSAKQMEEVLGEVDQDIELQ